MQNKSWAMRFNMFLNCQGEILKAHTCNCQEKRQTKAEKSEIIRRAMSTAAAVRSNMDINVGNVTASLKSGLQKCTGVFF